jgi:tetratricopeptide (TPR) repeat protein
MTPQEYDAGYRQWQLARLSRYKNQYLFSLKPKELDEAKKKVQGAPTDAKAHVELALALLRTRKGKEAKAELDAALAIDPKNPDAHYVAAQLARGEKDVEGAKKHLDTMRSNGNDGYAVHSMLADIAEEQKNDVAMRFHLEAAYRFDPSQSEPLKGLFDLANQQKREGDALAALEKLAQLEQHDRKVWRLLLEKLVAAKRWEDARRIGESAIFVDIMGGPTHALYAKALSAQNAHDKAVFELETAVLCPGKPPEKATAHALLAQELVALKRNADAKKHLDEALKLDPENAEAKSVKIP